MLYPQLNEKRLVVSLDGIWDFALGDENLDTACLTMPLKEAERLSVPASYNDQKVDIRFRDHYGWAYYQRRFSVPDMQDCRLVLRFGAVTHNAAVYLNGIEIARHTGGFLPFEAEIDSALLKGSNLLSVAVDNRINYGTLPVGNEENYSMFGSGAPDYESVRKTNIKPQNYPNFDFFNYCGINRPVKLYTTPREYIKDVAVTTEIAENQATVRVYAELSGDGEAQVSILDAAGNEVARGAAGEDIAVKKPILWQPNKAYLYTAKVTYKNDCYYQKFGIRSIEIKGDKFLINGAPFYFKGFGKHEDSEVHGRGIDEALNVKDISLMKWIGANSFRTSHYPYSEEMLSLCDEEGIVVIAETPAVGLNSKSYKNTIETHRQVISDMISRDKNHPSIVMWSLANEPNTEDDEAYGYFMPLYEHAHSLDPQGRPVTVVACNNNYVKDKVAPAMDVICVNRYYGWYIFPGNLDAAQQATRAELEYFAAFGKPLMITEYGADAVGGIHSAVPNMFSEEFQAEYYKAINAVLDEYGFVIGEHAWNFADFQTVQGTMRADGNKKGVFTRDRRPKLAAHYLKERWHKIPDFNFKG